MQLFAAAGLVRIPIRSTLFLPYGQCICPQSSINLQLYSCIVYLQVVALQRSFRSVSLAVARAKAVATVVMTHVTTFLTKLANTVTLRSRHGRRWAYDERDVDESKLAVSTESGVLYSIRRHRPSCDARKVQRPTAVKS